MRRYAGAESFPERAIRRPNPSRTDPYLAHLERRMAEGCENAMALWREIRGQGFTGSQRHVHRFVAERRAAPARRTARKWLSCTRPAGAEGERHSPKQLAWFLMQPNAALPSHAASALARIRQDTEAMRVDDLARRFTTLVRASGVDSDRPPDAAAAFEARLVDLRTCGIAALQSFAAELAQDGAAVRAALTTPWSNGQAEGHISRL